MLALFFGARVAEAQTYNVQGPMTGTRTETGAAPLPATSIQTLTLYQSGSSVTGLIATYWPGTAYFWTGYVSGSISGSALSVTWTPSYVSLPSGVSACSETRTITLSTTSGVTTGAVAGYAPCGGSATLANYTLTLTGWQTPLGCSPCSASGQDLGEQVGDPIDTASGNIYETFKEYETAGPNKLSFTRYFNSYIPPPPQPISGVNVVYLPGVPQWTTTYDRALIESSSTVITAQRPDGKQLTFTLVSSVWTPPSDTDITLTNSGSTWTLTNHDDTVETYTMGTGTSNGYAVLNTIRSRNGYTQTLARNGDGQVTSVTDSYGRELVFTYYSRGQLDTVTTPDSLVLTYTYSSSGIYPDFNDRVATVSYNTSPITSQTYNYANTSFPSLLTSVTDENSNTYESWTYDSYGRALTSQTGTGSNANITTLTYNDSTGTRTVKNALGVLDTYTFGALQNTNKVLKISRAVVGSVAAASESFTYDSNGYLASKVDWNGNTTTFTNDAHGDPTTIVEGSGSSAARTTTLAYDSTFVHLPDTITTTGLTTGYTYDSNGNPLTKVLTDSTSQSVPYSTNGQTRTWHYSWSDYLPATVETPNGNTTTFTFSSSGALTNTENALSQNTQITSYTGGGLPLTIVDPNSVTTTLTYSPRNWLLTKTVHTTAGNLTTTNSYDAAGNLTEVEQPDGSYLTNSYDTAHRLTKVVDSFGNSINYTLDALGDRTVSNIENSSGTVTRGHTATYDDLGRKLTDVGGESQTTTFTHDPNSNTTEWVIPTAGYGYYTTYDALNRPLTETVYNWGDTITTYDAHSRVLTFEDRNSHTTSYVYDGFGDKIQQTSPDTGTTVYHYDSDGNLTSKTDALSVVSNNTYDTLDRMLTTTYPADSSENVAYTYDQTGTGFAFGIGRLTSLTDAAGSLTRTYDERGNLITDSRVIGSTTLATTYGYDAASRVLTITYPDNSLVTYTRDAMGRITAVSDKPSGASSATTLASSVTYKPFGPWAGFTGGNSITETPTWDADYRLTELTDIGTATVQSISYGYSTSSQVSTYTDNVTGTNTLNQTAYDSQHRLIQWAQASAWNGPVFDGNSNRTSNEEHGVTTTYTTTAGTNQIATLATSGTTTTVTTNANGNITGFSVGFGTQAVTALAYNKANRLSSVSGSSGTLGAYVYDSFGRRLEKTVGSATTLYQYTPSSMLLAETNGTTATDYIYLNGRPLAMLSGTTFTSLHDDTLGRPQAATNSSQGVVWKASYGGFGEPIASSGTATVNLRFPGQYYDAESGFSNNVMRDYVPVLGRYLEADPTGLAAGPNLYAYANGDPIGTTDPLGLDCNSAGGFQSLYGNQGNDTDNNQESGANDNGQQVADNCTGPNSNCQVGNPESYNSAPFPDPENPGHYLCPICFFHTFQRSGTGDDTE